MRILHTDTDDLENPLRGGQPVRTFEINSRLAARHEITVLTATYKGCQRRQQRAGVRYRRLGLTVPGLGLSPHLSFLASLPLALRRLPHDLVVEEFTPPVGFCLAPWWSARPVVSIVQWHFFEDWERRYKLPFSKIMRALARRVDYRHFIVQTEAMAAQFRALMPRAQVHTVPCGIDDAAFRNADSEGDYALFLGRLDRQHKGLDYLIEAWRELAAGGLRIPLRIAGAGPAEAWLREQIRQHGLDDCISLIGRIEGAAKHELLSRCRLLAMPSRQETFGLTALEAMAASRPVVAFDIPHLNEVLDPRWAGLVPAGDSRAFARAVADCWQAPAHGLEMGRNGQRAAANYRWDLLARQQEGIYLDALSQWRQ